MYLFLLPLVTVILIVAKKYWPKTLSPLISGCTYEKIMESWSIQYFLVIKIVLDNLAFIWMEKKEESGREISLSFPMRNPKTLPFSSQLSTELCGVLLFQPRDTWHKDSSAFVKCFFFTCETKFSFFLLIIKMNCVFV